MTEASEMSAEEKRSEGACLLVFNRRILVSSATQNTRILGLDVLTLSAVLEEKPFQVKTTLAINTIPMPLTGPK
jgi:hypothetical protein